MARADDRIDELYQLPLDEFTPARNALAKELGDGGIKKLEKPNVAAWAVNQLYWRERKLYDEVIKTAEQLRTAYKQMLAGKPADVRRSRCFTTRRCAAPRTRSGACSRSPATRAPTR